MLWSSSSVAGRLGSDVFDGVLRDGVLRSSASNADDEGKGAGSLSCIGLGFAVLGRASSFL